MAPATEVDEIQAIGPVMTDVHQKGKDEFNSLLKHDGRGMMFLRILARRQGSIIPRVLPIAMVSVAIAVFQMICERHEVVPKDWLPVLRHPIAVQMLGVVLGYIIVLRTQVSVSRYFEGISHVQMFGSKWVDAFTQMSAFIRQSAKLQKKNGKDSVVEELRHLQFELLHWFSLLHACAVNSLQVTQIDVDENVFLSRMHFIDMPDLNVLTPPTVEDFDHSPMRTCGMLSRRDSRRCATGDDIKDSLENKDMGLKELIILGQSSPEELDYLRKADDKADLIHNWILEAISAAALNNVILIQSPILSRVYQELSNGMLGFNQAYKIALVQFPFAFAQMLTLFLLAFLILVPMTITVFTGGELLTPLLTLITVVGFWGIHEIAVEVENPFGTDVNQLPLVHLHVAVCETLFEATLAHLPQD
eukprot:gnl/MRDRNA2_/MRDRNA2_66222_c0_seq1.p1 gnl/MRDRNA2_/MRDRNA2_66222_c0~~gnl/MRDRNA2_/MRDRNA2_66222_c0_seq1.p1  ORF type:complete len:418 (-),score=55.92 gnl/MRDRNA2_/MRDRNA2_66222_c0_seq1:156-1409(-)